MIEQRCNAHRVDAIQAIAGEAILAPREESPSSKECDAG